MIKSQKYVLKEGGLSGELEDLTGDPNTPYPNNSVYRVTLKKPIANSDNFIDAITSDNLRIIVYQKSKRFLPEFEGRFFVKIQRDEGIDNNLLVTDFEDDYTPIAEQIVNPNIFNYIKDDSETYAEEAWAADGTHGKKDSKWIRPRNEGQSGVIFAGWKDRYTKRYSKYLLSSLVVQGTESVGGTYSWHPRPTVSSKGNMTIFASPYNGAEGRPYSTTLTNNDWTDFDTSIITGKSQNTFFDLLRKDAYIQFEGKTSASDTSLTKGETYKVSNVKIEYRRRGYNSPKPEAARVE